MAKRKKAITEKQKKRRDKLKGKKLGLAKFLHQVKPKKKQPTDEVDEPVKQKALDKAKAQVSSLQSVKKNLGLLDRCKLQMSSSMLRLIDEDLYSNDTRNVSLDKEKFLAYHEAYASVSEKWPTKPIDYIVKFIKRRIIGQRPIHKFKFADIGCGREPLLKMKLPPKAKVFSCDLVSTHDDIVEANMERLPIECESIHCVIYSLSLMAKNLGNILVEGKRVLKLGGSMLIAEVTSRFEGKEKKFTSKMEKLGFKQKTMTPMEPNGYFTFFHFTKLNSETNYSEGQLHIELKPCIYKAR